MEEIVITGASRGIGRAIAARLAATGRHFYLHGRDSAAVSATCRIVETKGAQTTPVIADIATRDGVDSFLAQIKAPQIDLVINNAGISFVGPVESITQPQWEKTLAVNVLAPILLTQKLLPRMRSGAAIISILSVAARTVFPHWSSYCMSKFALDGFTRALREELRPRGIRIINIYPAATATDIWNSIPGEWPRENMIKPEEVAEAVAYAYSRPASVLVEDITVGSSGGNL